MKSTYNKGTIVNLSPMRWLMEEQGEIFCFIDEYWPYSPLELELLNNLIYDIETGYHDSLQQKAFGIRDDQREVGH